ncbi:MAG: LLM class flavin-dependent oxidoreductase [Chloroflexota bacterium]|nr:LLM class flavin-dependent oxidoreductase [Chloroflexota bacterium]
MARHPWVAAADRGIRYGVQVVIGQSSLGELLETGKRIDDLGYDGLFIFDHPSIQSDPWLCLAALAGVTERVRLGSIVNCVPYRPPVHLARMAADLDNFSQGRLVLGLGIGWLKPEFRALGVPFAPAPERYRALREALAIIPGVWGSEPFSYAGEIYQIDAVQIEPPPLQQPRPPILIGGNGENVTLRLVAEHADACNISELQDRGNGQERVGGAETIKHKLDVLRRHCETAGRPEDEVLRSHFTLKLIMAPTEAALAEKMTRLAAVRSSSPATRRAQPSAFVTGTPPIVVAHYQALVDVGIQYFVIQIDANDQETLELFASEVMPRIQP